MTYPRVPEHLLRRIVALATRAPSVHNTQPWRWRSRGAVLELYADRSRLLRSTDPVGRDLVISCGATLDHARVAAQALGWEAMVVRLPDPARPDLLARLQLTRTAVPRAAAGMLEVIDRRCTDRRQFTSWPIPEHRLARLAARADERGARVLVLADSADRLRVDRLVERALDLQRRDTTIAAEQLRWLDHDATDGIPRTVVPTGDGASSHVPSRFAGGLLESTPRRAVDGSDGLLVLHGPNDAPREWLVAGEGLSSLWLAATEDGLSIVPLSQVVEVDETRSALHHDVLGGLADPLLVVRVGWQPIGRSELPRTPRRALDDVLELG